MVIIIGGGATGLGVAWDLILRGIPVTVVESGDIGAGTSGRFHGLLHSGARYVVTDPVSAKQCRDENIVLRRIAPSAIETVGGYFVAVDEVGESFIPRWKDAARACDIPVREVDRDTLFRRLPELNREASRGFFVRDAVLEGFKLLYLLRSNIEKHGGTVLTHATVTGVQELNGRVTGVTVRTGSYDRVVPGDAIVNASGPWAADVARLFGDQLGMHLTSGLMLIYANRMVQHIVNRLALPGDGDILVPHGHTVILGTTEVAQARPESPQPTREEANYLHQLGQKLFPAMSRWRVLRAFSGVRPLFESDQKDAAARHSRDFRVLDHGARSGLTGAFSIVGGKWTTYRLMAQQTGDAVTRYLGQSRPSLSARTILEPAEVGERRPGRVICECETVTEDELCQHLNEPMDAWRSRLWFAMGPCQGAICAHRGAALRVTHDGVLRAVSELRALRQERDRGIEPVAWGDNARELAFKEALVGQTLAEGGIRGQGR